MKNNSLSKKIASVALCAVMSLSVVSGIGLQGTSFDTAVTSYAAEAELKLNKTEKDMLPYYYQKMTDTEKSNYLKLRKGIMEQKSSIKLGRLTEQEVDKLMHTAGYYDDLAFNFTGIEYEIGPSYTKIMPKYKYSKKSYINMINALDKKAAEVNAKFTEKTSTYAKIKYIHDYVAKKCTYTLDATAGDYAYGTIVSGKGDCDGYARAFSYLCRSAGIWTVNVVGDTGEAHMWNKVYYNKKWYNVDVTNDDCGDVFKDGVQYQYFMVSDSQISKTHKVDPCEYKIPAANDSSKTYYKMYKLHATTASEAKSILVSQIAAGASNGKGVVTIQMPDDATYNSVVNYFSKDNSKATFDLLSSAAKKTKATLITNGCQSYGDPNTRTFTVCYFVKGKNITDYFTSLSELDKDTKDFLKQLGLKVA